MSTRRFSRVLDREHFWDSSSDEETQQQRQSNIEMIDLTESSEPILYPAGNVTTTPAAARASASARHDGSTYIPSTLPPNSARYSILPAFPTSIYDEQPPPLLLANVPLRKLDAEQRARRQPRFYPLIYSINQNKEDIPSYFRDHHQSFMNSLVQQYRVDESILDYNLHRFSHCLQLFANDLIRRHHNPADYFLLNDEQKRYALEFYLQIDVDLFFMKTCSFRGAKPRSRHETLFCVNEPHSQYAFSPCQDCSLCVPRYNPNNRERLGPMIRFGQRDGHVFRNGYRALLNCPANCQTNNLIYVITCPCGQFEYIGETTQRLNDRLRYHRQQFNRMFHEFLLGEANIQANQVQEKDKQTLTKDRMLLYRHAVRCPPAMQIFLNFNPIYWCFAPLRYTEVAVQNREKPTLPATLVSLDSIYPTSIASKDRATISETPTTRSDEGVRICMRNLPPVPDGYDFSIQQRAQQFQYFKDRHDLTHRQNPVLDLFNVAVVAVLPEDVSETVRRFVEALFITHAETKLNTSGRLVIPSNQDDHPTNYAYDLATDLATPALSLEIQQLDREEWCFDLIFPHHRPYMILDEP